MQDQPSQLKLELNLADLPHVCHLWLPLKYPFSCFVLLFTHRLQSKFCLGDKTTYEQLKTEFSPLFSICPKPDCLLDWHFVNFINYTVVPQCYFLSCELHFYYFLYFCIFPCCRVLLLSMFSATDLFPFQHHFWYVASSNEQALWLIFEQKSAAGVN